VRFCPAATSAQPGLGTGPAPAPSPRTRRRVGGPSPPRHRAEAPGARSRGFHLLHGGRQLPGWPHEVCRSAAPAQNRLSASVRTTGPSFEESIGAVSASSARDTGIEPVNPRRVKAFWGRLQTVDGGRPLVSRLVVGACRQASANFGARVYPMCTGTGCGTRQRRVSPSFSLQRVVVFGAFSGVKNEHGLFGRDRDRERVEVENDHADARMPAAFGAFHSRAGLVPAQSSANSWLAFDVASPNDCNTGSLRSTPAEDRRPATAPSATSCQST